jgi:outer membrane protein assembly factor BamB
MVPRFVWAWVLSILAAATAQAQIPISRDMVPTRTAMARLGLERHWMVLVPVSGTERLLSISLAENLLFTQSSMANFSAYDAESGRLLWTAHLGSQTATARPASLNSRLVFVTNANNLFAIDRRSGIIIWEVNLGILPTSPTACDEHQVMVGLSNGKLASFALYPLEDKTKTLYPTPRASWNWLTGGGSLTSRPLPAGQFVAFGGRDGKLYVAMSELPQDNIAVLLYRVATGGEIFAPLGSHGTRTVLVPSADKNVYAVDLFTADVKWVVPTGAPVMQEPLAAGDDVYAVNVAGLLRSLDANTGEQRWITTTQGGRLNSISPKRLYLESHDEDLFIVDRGTGQILADPRVSLERAGLNLREFTVNMTNVVNDRLYMATPSGMLICLREIGQLRPQPLRDPKLPPFGTIPPEGVTTPAAPAVVAPAAAPPAAAPPAAAPPANP